MRDLAFSVSARSSTFLQGLLAPCFEPIQKDPAWTLSSCRAGRNPQHWIVW
jgi:hypothetical protein